MGLKGSSVIIFDKLQAHVAHPLFIMPWPIQICPLLFISWMHCIQPLSLSIKQRQQICCNLMNIFPSQSLTSSIWQGVQDSRNLLL